MSVECRIMSIEIGKKSTLIALRSTRYNGIYFELDLL